MAFDTRGEHRRYRRYFTNITQAYRQKKVRTYAGIVFSILTVSFFVVFAIKPTLITIAVLNKELKDQREVAKKLDNKITALSSAYQEHKKLSLKLYLIDEALPQKTEISLLTKQIEFLASQTNVEIINLRYTKTTLKGEESTEEAKKVNFALGASGSFQNLKELLHSLGSLKRTIIINSFGFKAPKGNEPQSALTLTINADAYFLRRLEDEKRI